MRRNGFTMVELVFVIVIIGALSAVAIPKFSGVKDHAKAAVELSTAAAISSALEEIHGAWSTSEDEFDWNNDGIADPIDTLSYHGYPKDLKRNNDDMGALFRTGKESGFIYHKEFFLKSENNVTYSIYTGKASDPTSGVPFPTDKIGKDKEGKPDRNDFWLYVVDANASGAGSCHTSSDHSRDWDITSGDFLLIDVNGTLPLDFNDPGLGIGFSISCH
ncbi:MAG: hypothetical protein DSZ06_00585 [Sulfurospirillum sp.]|nr:MAG: hypothetical protein DSZ06_00585 [Sulfurospirillum sp.]